jgi:hypothetical protein
MAGVRRLSGKHCYPLVEGGVVAVAGPGEGPTSFSRVRKLLMPHGTPAETASLELPFIGFCSVSLSVSVGSLNAAPSLVRIPHCHGAVAQDSRCFRDCFQALARIELPISSNLAPSPNLRRSLIYKNRGRRGSLVSVPVGDKNRCWIRFAGPVPI